MGKKQRKTLIFIFVFVFIVAMVLTYFYQNDTLASFGLTRMNYEKWDVHFKNLSVSTVGDADYSKPTFFNTVVTDYDVMVNNPGDAATFQFLVVNEGTTRAKLADIVKSIPKCSSEMSKEATAVCEQLIYELKNDDGSILEKGIEIDPNTSKIVKLTVAYPKDSKKISHAVQVKNLDVDLLFARS